VTSSGDVAFDRLLDGVARAHEGDADAVEEVVAPDVVWRDDDDLLHGVDEVVAHFLAHGGWREVFELGAVERQGHGRWLVDWTLWLRADATSLRRDGRARVTVDDGLITRWESSATETEDGSLAAWGDD
jgi:hypothetical protein